MKSPTSLRQRLSALRIAVALDRINRDQPVPFVLRPFFGRLLRRDAAVLELVQFAERDPSIREVMHRQGITTSDLERVYTEIVATGGALWIRGHYLPTATLLNPIALSIYLNADRGSWDAILSARERVWRFFRNSVGKHQLRED